METNKRLLVCKCPGKDADAKAAFSVLFPGEPVPEVLIGRSQILTLSEQYPRTEISSQARAMARNKDKYAYYLEYDNDGMVLNKYNLMTGAKVQ